MTLYQKLKILKHFGVKEYKDDDLSVLFNDEPAKVGDDFKVVEEENLELAKSEIKREIEEGINQL